MNAIEAFNAGSLEEALEIAKGEVKNNPTDVARRNTYCELLCWVGELEKADKQLETLMMQDPSAAMGLSLFRQLIRGELSRQECFHKGRAPELLEGVDDLLQKQIELLLAMREGMQDRARELAEVIEQERPRIQGICDGNAFDDLRDLDDTCSTFFEVLTSTGKYYWIPMSRVLVVQLHPITRPRDLMWRRAHMIVQDGPDGEVYLPLNYALSLGSEDKQLRLGRATDWKGGEEGPVQGLGRRMMLIGEEDRSLLEVSEFLFGDAAAEQGSADSAGGDAN